MKELVLKGLKAEADIDVIRNNLEGIIKEILINDPDCSKVYLINVTLPKTLPANLTRDALIGFHTLLEENGVTNAIIIPNNQVSIKEVIVKKELTIE